MKKMNYIKPVIDSIEINCSTLMNTSYDDRIQIDKKGSGDEQLSGAHRGNWGELWK